MALQGVITIDGRPCRAPEGAMLLDILRREGVPVPTLCHDARLAPAGSCRLCMVRIEGAPRPVASCTTPASNGMVVRTDDPEIDIERREIVRMLARGLSRASFDRLPAKEVHRLVRAYGLEAEVGAAAHPTRLDDSHPYLRVDMSQCIACYRCVRICADLQGQFVWHAFERGERTEIRPGTHASLRQSPCVACGACADTCPTGAIADRTIWEQGEPTAFIRTTCSYCGVGCEMEVGTRDGRIVEVLPARDSPVNKGHLCVKGRYAHGFVHAPDRADHPMIRDGAGAWRRVHWDEAIDAVARGFRRALDLYGPGAVGVLGSARGTNEENYAAQKFARVVLGTHNVDCCARVCHAPSAAAMRMAFGTGAATGSFDDIERARTILVCGANVTGSHPVVGARIRQAVLRGAHLIVIDPRRIEIADHADCHLALRPGTNIPLLHAMAHVIVEEGLADEPFIAARTTGVAEFRAFLRDYSPEATASVTGVPPDLVRRAARLYATSKPSLMVHGLGVTEHVQGTEGVLALANLALLTGNVGKPGTGVNPLRGQNNVQGSAHMGCEPSHLPGFAPVEDGRSFVEGVWGVPLPKGRGLNLMEMMDAAAAGRFKALWAIGYDIYLTNPNAAATERALHGLDFLVVQDLFLTETAREAAHVFLPAASSFEKDGTFMNGERRVSRVRKAIEPVGEARSDWEIVAAVARAMGHGQRFAWRTAEEIWEEVRKVWKPGRGISYARIERGGIQWPCPSEDHPGTGTLHQDSFQASRTAELRRIPFAPSEERPTDEFPLILVTGRDLYRFNAGTMTERTPNALLGGPDYLALAPDDALRAGLADGDRAVVKSRHGETRLRVACDAALQPGVAYATFSTADGFVNRVTGNGRDLYTMTPEYKVTAVGVRREA